MTGVNSSWQDADGFLGPDDPPPFAVINPDGARAAVLVCDHASNAIPAVLGDLGLDAAARARHIAWDIGAAEVTHRLTEILDAPAVLSGYSRLVADCNRSLDDPTAMRQISDGVIIAGNRNLDASARARRGESCYWPYHRAVIATIERVALRGTVPAIISVHSCTPVYKGFERPWHVGVLSNTDRRLADLLIAELSRETGLCVGDNQPYSGLDPHGYTIENHALPDGRPNVLLEIRQDLIDTQHGVEHWSALVGEALVAVLDHPAAASTQPGSVREAS